MTNEIYNVHEHNHIEWPEERLQRRLGELSANSRSVGYSGERAAQVGREMSIIAFELSERLRSEYGQDIQEAWYGIVEA